MNETVESNSFLTGRGFQFSVGNHPAEILPQHGLIPIIAYEDEIPIEEVVHHHTITRAPHYLGAILREYWGDDSFIRNSLTESSNRLEPWIGHPSEGPLYSVQSLKPIVEGLNMIYSGSIDEEVRKVNDSYADAVQSDLYHRISDVSGDSPDTAGGTTDETTVDTKIRREIEDYVERKFALTGNTIIRLYLSQGLFENDRENTYFPLFCHGAELNEMEKSRITYQIFEVFLFKELSRGSMRYIPGNWTNALEILDRWIHEVHCHESPFPFQNESFNFDCNFLLDWSVAVVEAMRVVANQLLSPEGSDIEDRFVSSLPAVASLVHPFVYNYYTVPNTPHQSNVLFPWLLLPPEDKEGVALMKHRPDFRRGIIGLQFWDQMDCQIYTTGSWVEDHNAIVNNPTDYESYGEAAVKHLLNYAYGLESLWHEYHDRSNEAPCLHCRHILEIIHFTDQNLRSGDTEVRSLAQMLENRCLTVSDTDPLIDAAERYSDWLEEQIDYTYRHHSLLAEP
jgi:hypothetical protein